MTVYLLHFDKPISDHHTAQHYIGYTNNLEDRIAEHRNGSGARFVQVAIERGVNFVVARTWKGDRKLERQLKNKKHSSRLCPICRGKQ